MSKARKAKAGTAVKSPKSLNGSKTMPPPQIIKITGVLNVITEPETTFFKDEGGKNHCMTCVVKLNKLKVANAEEASFEKWLPTLPLRVSLYYESGLKVEERDQEILKILGSDFECLAISPQELTCSIRYRIEKVSRRKDGQLFKIFVEADPDQCSPFDVSGITACFSAAVCVRSKRKASKASRALAAALANSLSGNSQSSVSSADGRRNSIGSDDRPTKRARRSSIGRGGNMVPLDSLILQLNKRVSTLSSKVDEMMDILRNQQVYINSLDAAVRGASHMGRVSGHLSRLNSTDSGKYNLTFSPMNHYKTPANVNSPAKRPSSSPNGTGNTNMKTSITTGGTNALRRSISNNSLSGGGIRSQPLALKRLRSGDMQFDFGRPTLPPGSINFATKSETF